MRCDVIHLESGWLEIEATRCLDGVCRLELSEQLYGSVWVGKLPKWVRSTRFDIGSTGETKNDKSYGIMNII